MVDPVPPTIQSSFWDWENGRCMRPLHHPAGQSISDRDLAVVVRSIPASLSAGAGNRSNPAVARSRSLGADDGGSATPRRHARARRGIVSRPCAHVGGLLVLATTTRATGSRLHHVRPGPSVYITLTWTRRRPTGAARRRIIVASTVGRWA